MMELKTENQNNEYFELKDHGIWYELEILINELDLVMTPKVSKHLNIHMSDIKYPSMIVNLDNLTYIDSTGISFLITLGKETEGYGNKMVLLCSNSSILQVFDTIELKNFIRICNNFEDALRYVKSD